MFFALMGKPKNKKIQYSKQATLSNHEPHQEGEKLTSMIVDLSDPTSKNDNEESAEGGDDNNNDDKEMPLLKEFIR